jgi:hypothetical protein
MQPPTAGSDDDDGYDHWPWACEADGQRLDACALRLIRRKG